MWTSTLTDAAEDKTCKLVNNLHKHLAIITCSVLNINNNIILVNLKVGFDLTQEENGAPSLRIREFDGK